MATEIILPRVDMAMESGSVARWAVKNGDAVKTGDLVFEMNTDKSVMEVEATASGTIAGIAVDEGVEMPVGAVLAYILATGETDLTSKIAAPAPSLPTPDKAPEQTDSTSNHSAVEHAVASSADDENQLRATPLARQLAREAGIKIATVQGTGPLSRIEAGDVKRELSVMESSKGDAGQSRIKMRRWLTETKRRGAIMLVHGFGSNGATWEALSGALARNGFDVYAPDLAGHGDTAINADNFDAVVSSLENAFTLVGYDRFHLVGHSMGAAAVVLAASRNRQRITRLTLLAPFGVGPEIDSEFIAGIAHANKPGAIAELLQLLTVRSVPYSSKQLLAITKELGRGRLTTLASQLVNDGKQAIDIRTELANLPCPVDVVFGIGDKIIPWYHAANLPHRVAARFVADAGHMLHVDELPVLNDLLAKHLAD
ncbi:MAG: acetoin dehydrogenase dihydrolipoyllysine-residue acetyltransferase subunit [Alphaproteobacteria bacterium]|nr:acetoin dehydrogenase dihydrolipoyllysine-residue acetyltransferase subunit [Alphaproteobacteria bacterium]